ncbi:MAG: hypothetical protein A2581_04085 [Candidatus Staskawiczbacteria bacterium RIFOXYD1_FULL_37_110]|nr:MAG: hypothetical protein A2581_04085 [Candidatus Staskawiczbacteria bacterium RIFOXYD1_FULL_37_110]
MGIYPTLTETQPTGNEFGNKLIVSDVVIIIFSIKNDVKILLNSTFQFKLYYLIEVSQGVIFWQFIN